MEGETLTTRKITAGDLMAFAQDKPPGDPEVQTMLIKWMEETGVREEAGALSVEYLRVAMLHSAMKYRFGFLTREEVLEELEETRQGVVAEYGDTADIHQEISDLMYDIEDGVFR